MSRNYTSPRGMGELREGLSGRDLALIGQVADLRLMTGRQIEAIHFPAEDHLTAFAAARATRRALQRLTRDRLLVRLERRVGGIRAGSGSFIYGLGPVGHRLLALSSPRPRFYREPAPLFIEHTLAIGNLVIGLTLAARSGQCQLLSCQTEPRCWRDFTGPAGRVTIKPDLFVALGIDEYEDRFFVEVDRGTEHLPALMRKCRQYDAYYRSGLEQDRHGVFPKVCLVVPDDERAKRLEGAIASDRRLEPALFVVATAEQAIDTLIGANS